MSKVVLVHSHAIQNFSINLLIFNINQVHLLTNTLHSSLSTKCSNIRTNKSMSFTCNCLGIDILIQFHVTGVNTEHFQTAIFIGNTNVNFTIKTSKTTKSRINSVGAVGTSNNNDGSTLFQPIHERKHLTNNTSFYLPIGLFTFWCNGINLINKDNAGGILLGLGEDITDTGSSHSNKHLYEFGTGDGDEGNTSLTSNGLGKKSLTCSGRTIQDNSSGNSASVLGVNLRLLQKVNNLNQFHLGSITSGDILKVDSSIRDHLNLGLGLTHTHGVSRSAHTSWHTSSRTTAEEEETSEESRRKDERLSKIAKTTGCLVGGEHSNINLVASELCQKLRIVGESLKLNTCSIGINSKKLGSIGREGDLLDTVAIDKFEEVRVTHIDGCSTT
mmetsp:Transcript_27199/g.39835  ORF Transcript_27199/g.39835 Transcript_27199/m.39835 type:complete len:387 (+) Transcript_27199:1186-2346(+)